MAALTASSPQLGDLYAKTNQMQDSKYESVYLFGAKTIIICRPSILG